MTEETILKNLKTYYTDSSKAEIQSNKLKEDYKELVESSKELDLNDQDIRNKLWNAVKAGADYDDILASTARILGKRHKTEEEKKLLRSRNTVNSRISRYFRKLMKDLKAPGSIADQINSLKYYEEVSETDNVVAPRSPTSVAQLPDEPNVPVAAKRTRTPRVRSDSMDTAVRAPPKKKMRKQVAIGDFLSVYLDSRFGKRTIQKLHKMGAVIGELLYPNDSLDDYRCEWKFEIKVKNRRLQFMIMQPDLINLPRMNKNGYTKLEYSSSSSSSSSM
jgi:hypothetical protein